MIPALADQIRQVIARMTEQSAYYKARSREANHAGKPEIDAYNDGKYEATRTCVYELESLLASSEAPPTTTLQTVLAAIDTVPVWLWGSLYWPPEEREKFLKKADVEKAMVEALEDRAAEGRPTPLGSVEKLAEAYTARLIAELGVDPTRTDYLCPWLTFTAHLVRFGSDLLASAPVSPVRDK